MSCTDSRDLFTAFLAGLLDGSWLTCPPSPTSYRLFMFLSSFLSSPLPYILWPSLPCKRGLFLSTSPPLFFFRNVNNYLPFYFPLLGQRPVLTVKICLKHPADVNSLSFQHSSTFFVYIYFSCCLSITTFCLISPYPSSVTFFLSFPLLPFISLLWTIINFFFTSSALPDEATTV